MTIRMQTSESHVKLAAPELPAGIRSGGENRPLDFPHLYQIQAGDWRISYAVEHNRLAILVLEVLGADGESSKDARQADLTKKMKVKLLDWPDSGEGTQIPPEEISKKLKIKWMDLAEDAKAGKQETAGGAGRIKLRGGSDKPASEAGRSRITLLDSGEAIVETQADGDDAQGDVSGDERKVTPLDEPSM